MSPGMSQIFALEHAAFPLSDRCSLVHAPHVLVLSDTGLNPISSAFSAVSVDVLRSHTLAWRLRAAFSLSSCSYRDQELAKFEAFLNQEKCQDITALVRGRQQLAYPIKG